MEEKKKDGELNTIKGAKNHVKKLPNVITNFGDWTAEGVQLALLEFVKNGSTVPELAKKIGLRYPSLYNFLRGTRGVQVQTMWLLIRFLENQKKINPWLVVNKSKLVNQSSPKENL